MNVPILANIIQQPNSGSAGEAPTPFHAIYYFGGSGTDPDVEGEIGVWDLTKAVNANEYYNNLGGNSVGVVAVGGAGNGPPTLSSGQYWGWKTGNTDKATSQTVTGTNLYPNAALSGTQFSQFTPFGARFSREERVEVEPGVFEIQNNYTGIPNGTYKVIIVSLRTNDSTARSTRFNVNGGPNLDVVSNNSGSANVLTSASGTPVFDSGSGQTYTIANHIVTVEDVVVTDNVIHIKGEPIVGDFGYLTIVDIEKTA